MHAALMKETLRGLETGVILSMFPWQQWQTVAQEPAGEWQVANPQSVCVCVRLQVEGAYWATEKSFQRAGLIRGLICTYI